MRLRYKLFSITLTRGLILVGLFALVLSGNLVFGQDFKQSIESEVEGEGYILVVTKSRTLNVRQKASSLSPVVGSLLNGSQVPFTGVTANDTANRNGFWYQVEYAKGKLGWVSGVYSKKIATPKKPVTPKKPAISQVTKLDSKNEVPIAKTKTENPESFLRSTDIVKPPTLENKKDSPPVESQGFFKDFFSSKTKKPDTTPSQKAKVERKKPWANIEGFRSAKFGMGRAEVTKAIFEDFGIASRNITIIKHPKELTQSLAVTVEQLLPKSGKSQVVYVFGYKSKRLMQVNIFIGHGVDRSVTAQQVVNSGNYLGNHLLRKRYQDDGLVAHARLNDGSVLILRGKDQKGRMVILRLSDPQSSNKDNEGLNIGLNLSYIEKPGQPDIYQLKEGDF
jgi:uncharacterized protein YgiM (DUF1202 family)